MFVCLGGCFSFVFRFLLFVFFFLFCFLFFSHFKIVSPGPPQLSFVALGLKRLETPLLEYLCSLNCKPVSVKTSFFYFFRVNVDPAGLSRQLVLLKDNTFIKRKNWLLFQNKTWSTVQVAVVSLMFRKFRIIQIKGFTMKIPK